MASRKDEGGSAGPPETQVTATPEGRIRIEIFDEPDSGQEAEHDAQPRVAGSDASLGDALAEIGRDLALGELDSPATSRPKRKLRTRGDRPHARTIAPRRLTKEELRQHDLLLPILDEYDRPQTRAECKDAPRPCPFVSCRHHLYLDVNPYSGSFKLNFPHLEVWELEETCSLDVADRDGVTLEEVGEIMNLTRERIRQVEVRGLLKLKLAGAADLGDGSSVSSSRQKPRKAPASAAIPSEEAVQVTNRRPLQSMQNYSTYRTERFKRQAEAWRDERERRIALEVWSGTSVKAVARRESRTRAAIYLVLQKIARWSGRNTEEIAS